ncbi:MAG: hypothetical protein FWB78_06485 [Treponema sp.]|nr:hypothetical protein [Treponema sp.]
MKRLIAPAMLLGVALLVGCRTVEVAPPVPEDDGIVGRMVATPFSIFSSEIPCPSGVYFFNSRMQWYEVIRPVNDLATIIFFTSQDEADAYVRGRLEAERRPDVPLFESWPPPSLRPDFDSFAYRDLGEYLDRRLVTIRNDTIRHPDWGDTGHPIFRYELTGRVTEYFVYIRYGYVSQVKRLNVMSGNLHFHSVWWGDVNI